MRRRPLPPRLYAIADAATLAPTSAVAGVAQMAESGVRWIQLRAKELTGAEFYRQMAEIVRRLEGSPVELWIDDRADLAALFPVAGVHVGQDDLPPRAVRAVVGEEPWIGLSTHDRRQLEAADGDAEVDVVAVGPVYATASKERPDPVVGVEFVRRARRLTGKPLVAIGGIDSRNLGPVLAAGADSVAVLGAICRGNVSANCRRLLAAVERGG